MLEKIRSIIQKLSGGKVTEFDVFVPENPAFGHYSTNVAMKLAPRLGSGFIPSWPRKQAASAGLGQAPRQIAEKLVRKIVAAAPKNFFAKIEVAGPGFINFWLSNATLQNEFKKIAASRSDKYFRVNASSLGKLGVNKKRRVIVEYSSPNIAKPMHVGHLRSTIIGDVLANIYDFLGYKAICWNHYGDWGTQFGKLLAAYKLWGDKKEIEKNPIHSLLALYVRFHDELKSRPELEKTGREEFRKLEAGGKENKKLWGWFKKESFREFNKTYKKLGVGFDVSIGESFYLPHLKPLTAKLLRSGIARKSEGAIIVNLEKSGLPADRRGLSDDKRDLPPALIEKADGASLYFTREIASLEYRVKKYKPAKILYVVGNEQALHFEQLFAVAKLLGLNKTGLVHVKFGAVLGESGKKFATREGKVVHLEEVLEQAVALAREIVEKKNPTLSAREKIKVAETVGVAAVKYNDLRENRQSNIVFDWARMMDWKGDSAPYLLYTYARLASIQRKAGSPARSGRNKKQKMDIRKLDHAPELELIKKMADFGAAVALAAETLQPNYIAKYLYELANLANRFYESTPVLKESGAERRTALLALCVAAAETLKTGLALLGIKTLDKI